MRLLLLLIPGCMFAQSNDLFLMSGVDVSRPGNALKGNYSIGYGHTFSSLPQWTPLLDEVTVSYTYETAAHTEALGGMKNIALPKTKRFGAYTSINLGVTSFTGRHVENRLYSSFGGGLMIHLRKSYGVWVQEIVNKIATVPWYTTTSIAFVRSW